MIIGVDIGNTTTEIGFIKNQGSISSYKLNTDKDKTEDDWFFIIKDIVQYEDVKNVKAVILSSVVPPLNQKLKNVFKRIFDTGVFILGENLNYPIKINYENPKEVGADRIVNAVAVINLYGFPSIVIDFGTAITFDLINERGEYDGGAIFPGVKSSIEALFMKTAKLPLIELKPVKNPVGKNTVESIQTGIYNGFLSLINGMIDMYKNIYGQNTNIILTGGDAELFSDGMNKNHRIEPYLNMKGIYFVYKSLEKNKLNS